MIDALGKIRRELRFLKAYSVGITALLALMWFSGFRHPDQKQRFDEIDVERLNVVTADGKYAVVISNAARMPGNVMAGKEYPRNDSRGAGLLFYNPQGDEVGGLIFDASRKDDTVDAFGQLSLDRFGSDQVVALRYVEDPSDWTAGLQVSHFERNELYEWFAAKDSISKLPTAAQDAANGALRERFAREGKWEVPRVFVGERGQTAILEMRDTHGRRRIRLAIDTSDTPHLEFLDAKGKIVRSIPE